MLEYKTQKHNIRALVSKYIIEVVTLDAKHFNYSKYKLCNLILIKFALKFRSNYAQELIFEEKEYLQFTLHKENINYYTDIKRGVDGLNESEMIREIFSAYAILPPFLRELNLFREKITFILSAHKEYRVLKLHTINGIIEGRVEKVFRDKKTGYLQIKVNSNNYYISQTEIIS